MKKEGEREKVLRERTRERVRASFNKVFMTAHSMTQNFRRMPQEWPQSSPNIGTEDPDSNLELSIFDSMRLKFFFRSKFKLFFSNFLNLTPDRRSLDGGEDEKKLWWINLRYSCKKTFLRFQPSLLQKLSAAEEAKNIAAASAEKEKKSLAIKASIRLKISQLEWKASADRRHRRFPDWN